jgi:hypothetical protein
MVGDKSISILTAGERAVQNLLLLLLKFLANFVDEKSSL